MGGVAARDFADLSEGFKEQKYGHLVDRVQKLMEDRGTSFQKICLKLQMKEQKKRCRG